MNEQHGLTVVLRSRFPVVDIEAHVPGAQLAVGHVRDGIARTRPLSAVASERIHALREWAKDRAVVANG